MADKDEGAARVPQMSVAAALLLLLLTAMLAYVWGHHVGLAWARNFYESELRERAAPHPQ